MASIVTPLAACSDDSTPAISRDSGTAESLDGSGPGDASADAPGPPTDATTAFKTCTDAELAASSLFTNGADVSFFNAGVDGGALTYVNACVRIPKGKDVGWYGDFTAHPLANDGEPGTPIPNVATGSDSGRIFFPTAGKYSFHCTAHATTMFGTVLVEP